MSLSLLVGLLNEETYTLRCLSNIWDYDVDVSWVSPDGAMRLLMSNSVLVTSPKPSVSSYSETKMSLGLFLYFPSCCMLDVSMPEVEAPSMFLLGLLSSFWGIYKIVGVLMVASCCGTCRNEFSSSYLSRSIKVFSTSTFVLSLSTRVFSNHSDWLAYLSISSMGWWM